MRQLLFIGDYILTTAEFNRALLPSGHSVQNLPWILTPDTLNEVLDPEGPATVVILHPLLAPMNGFEIAQVLPARYERIFIIMEPGTSPPEEGWYDPATTEILSNGIDVDFLEELSRNRPAV